MIYGDTKYELDVCKIFAVIINCGKYGCHFAYLSLSGTKKNIYFEG
jgi:hypothetical protein